MIAVEGARRIAEEEGRRIVDLGVRRMVVGSFLSPEGEDNNHPAAVETPETETFSCPFCANA